MAEPESPDGLQRRYPHVFRPIQVGCLNLDHRLVVPPHGGGNGNLMGSDADFEQHAALWLAKLAGGMQWLGGGPNFVRNPLPAGFEPTASVPTAPASSGMPAIRPGSVSWPRRVHAGGGLLSVQMVLQGGMPIAPSATLSSYADHRIPHPLDRDEVQWLIREYAESAAIASDAGVDAIEIHANHDDVVQWFLSPLTNLRDDEYGGSAEGRRRFLREIVEAIRSLAPSITLGLRLCLDEMIDGGFGADDCAAVVAAFTAEGTVDYFSLDVGNNWGDPSYVPVGWYDDYQWAPLCGRVKAATNLPVVYAGRVVDVAQAEEVLAAGYADIVGHGARHHGRPRHRGQDTRWCRSTGDPMHRAQRVHPPQAGGGPRLRLRRQCSVRARSRAGAAAARSDALGAGGGRWSSGHRAGGAVRRTRSRRRAVGAQRPSRRDARRRGDGQGQPPLPGVDRLSGSSFGERGCACRPGSRGDGRRRGVSRGRGGGGGCRSDTAATRMSRESSFPMSS